MAHLFTLQAFSPAASPLHLRTKSRELHICAQQQPRGGIGGLFDEASARFWRELQKGAMQEELDPLPSELKNAPAPVPLGDVSSPLPDSFADSIRLAAGAVQEALDDGIDRLVIEFDTSAGDETYGLLSRTNTFVQPFLPQLSALLAPPADDSEGVALKDLPKMQLLFPDEGTSAYVAKNWQLPPNTVTGSMPRAKIADDIEVSTAALPSLHPPPSPPSQVLLLVAPAATEVPAVQRLISELDQAQPTLLILFNPKLVDMQSTGYGLVGRDLRQK
eukprot:Transcript_9845.p1 GENE.Transcript_9845~~Transcript_9845.p1  ORF type:complete len:275 (+),score=82.03 Transcript_9845:1653-2477(+)